MMYFRKPSSEAVHVFRKRLGASPYSYLSPGATLNSPAPEGFLELRSAIMLGHGSIVFEHAKQALREWKMFDFPWVELNADSEPTQGQDVAILARTCGLWFLNGCRIVYLIDEASRYGFAYGTLQGHVERGEERFLLSINSQELVQFEIYSFSKASTWLYGLANPYIRYLQRRFIRDALQAMKKTVMERLVA